MANRSTILHLLPGKVADVKTIAAIRTPYPTVFGFALQHEGELVREVYGDASFTNDDIMKLQNECKDAHRILFFGNFASFEDEDDIQPYIVNNGDGVPILAVFYEGDFSALTGLNGKHTDEYCTWEETVVPRISKLYEEVDGDYDKFIEKMKSEATKKILSNAFKERGWYTFLPFKGDPWSFGANSLAKGGEWGTVSNGSDIVFDIPKETEKPEVKKSSPLSFMGKKAKAEAPVEITQPSPNVTANPPKVPENQPSITPAITAGVYSPVMVRVPHQLEGSVRNGWIRLFCGPNAPALVGDGNGDLPGNHQQQPLDIPVHPAIVDFTKRPVNNTADLKKLSGELRGLAKARGPMDFKSDPPLQKAETGLREPVSNYATPTLSDGDKTKAMEKFVKFLDAASKKRRTPLELQQMESKWPVFSAEIGVKFEELLFRSVDEIKDLFDGNMIATCAFIEMRRKYVETSGVKLEDLAGSAPKEQPKAPEKQVEVPSAQPEPATAKKSPLGFMKKKAAA